MSALQPIRRPLSGRRLFVGAVVLLSLAAILVPALGLVPGHDRSADAPFEHSLFGPFAGYLWGGDVHRISAVVTVPSMLESSQDEGAAATWIGATGVPGRRSVDGPFVQVGINEFRELVPSSDSEQDEYYAFWSSTARDFHPQMLFNVMPGDRVRVSMTLAHGQWRVVAHDLSSGDSQHVSVNGGRAPYNYGSWLQEDVDVTGDGGQAPYPKLSGLRVSQMRVNSTAPKPHALAKSWMSTARGTFGPTRVHGEGFAIRQVHLTAADLRYEQIAYALNYPAAAFDYESANWSARTSRAVIRRDCNALARVLRKSAARFEAYRWPANVQALVRRLVVATRKGRRAVLALADLPPSARDAGRSAYVASLLEASNAALQIKSRLHMPTNNYSGGALQGYIDKHPA